MRVLTDFIGNVSDRFRHAAYNIGNVSDRFRHAAYEVRMARIHDDMAFAPEGLISNLVVMGSNGFYVPHFVGGFVQGGQTQQTQDLT